MISQVFNVLPSGNCTSRCFINCEGTKGLLPELCFNTFSTLVEISKAS